MRRLQSDVMKRYHVWRSTWPNDQYAHVSIPWPDVFDHLHEAQLRGQEIAWMEGGVNLEWKQVAEFSWRLLTNGIPTEIFIYDRKEREA